MKKNIWKFGVSVELELDNFVFEECKEHLIIKEGCSFYVWTDVNMNLDGFDSKNDNLIFKFFLECNDGKMLVKKDTIQLGKLNYNPLTFKSHILKEEVLQISYSAFKYDDENERLGQINIRNISLTNFNVYELIKENTDGHKITCMINDNYLFRAQFCNTNDDNEREYKWFFQKLKNNEEYISDLELIKIKDCVSSKERDIKLIPFKPDDDIYCDLKSKLPILIKKNEWVYFRLFNFRFIPPRCVETIFQYKDFVIDQPLKEPLGKPIVVLGMIRKRTNRILEEKSVGTITRNWMKDALKISIMFIKEKEQINLISISVKAKDYNKTLQQFLFYFSRISIVSFVITLGTTAEKLPLHNKS